MLRSRARRTARLTRGVRNLWATMRYQELMGAHHPVGAIATAIASLIAGGWSVAMMREMRPESTPLTRMVERVTTSSLRSPA